MLRVLLPLLAVGLAVYALVDLASSDEDERGGIPRGLWVVLIILLPFLGPIAWILVKRSASRSGARSRPAGRPGPGSAAGGARRRRNAPVAPDDDPEFLWRLEQQQRRQARDDSPAPADDAPATDATPGDERTDDGDARRPGASNPSEDGDDATR
ncbi:PLD nuclease N-terminal domain-containing protein [Cellulosimicrobium sp. JZ28]|uniref:PLD nuclease N-terminal domain-containing protein n=1 Tax=Cellulosimicrobium sp. JZ28 TaxID=1906273 RepID=UPI00188B4AE9|nr:PLD nuclease N-terminal domain-containing protein [Cellulosimicrobium sp. JZ28]